MADDLIALNESLGLFLKPLAKLYITVMLPEKKIVGKTISNWEVMEMIKKKIHPETFVSLKVCTSSLTKVLLEAEVKSINQKTSIIKKLDASFIKLSGFQDKFMMAAEPAKIKIIKKSEWVSFFSTVQDFSLALPGERADTVYLEDLPSAWFKSSSKTIDENVLDTFSRFGKISRHVVPMLDSYEERINNFLETGCDIHSDGFRKTSFLARGLMFDVYIQYAEYSGFCSCVDALNGMKMVRIVPSEPDPHFCNFKLDFDRLSDKTIKARDQIRTQLIERDFIHEQELDAKRSEQDKLEEEKQKEEQKRLEEEANLKAIKEQEDIDRRKKKMEDMKNQEEKYIQKLDADIKSIQHKINSVHECRLYSAVELIKKAINHAKHEIQGSHSLKRKHSRRTKSRSYDNHTSKHRENRDKRKKFH